MTEHDEQTAQPCRNCKHYDIEHGASGDCWAFDRRTTTGYCLCERFEDRND